MRLLLLLFQAFMKKTDDSVSKLGSHHILCHKTAFEILDPTKWRFFSITSASFIKLKVKNEIIFLDWSKKGF